MSNSETMTLDWLTPIRWASCDEQRKVQLMQRPIDASGELSASVSAIIRRVREGGDAELCAMTAEFDGVTLSQQALEVPASALERAVNALDPAIRQAIDDASTRIATFHAADKPRDGEIDTAPGLTCRVSYQSLSPVGLYIPGGTAPLISTVLMLAVPARLAGCEEIILCSPPGADGDIAPEVLAAASLSGVSRVFRIGGAQAIAAMAYGSESVPRCAKLFGPGNSWVTEAKQQVSQDPQGAAIDLPAGPSEVLVIADNDANAEFVAWDLLSQAEHGEDSQVILLSDSATLCQQVIDEVRRLVPESPRSAILNESLKAARIIVMDSLDQAVSVSNIYAPEHLIINTRDAEQRAQSVRNAGSVFVGQWTPESLGDYCSGTNHVLPTYGWARSHGALGIGDFMRRMTFQQASAQALAAIGPTAEVLAEAEGLDAHRMAVRARINRLESMEQKQ